MNMSDFANFLGWCTVLNFGILVFSTVMVCAFGQRVAKIHGRMFGIDSADLPKVYFGYLANLKILILVFSLVPYLAMRILLR